MLFHFLGLLSQRHSQGPGAEHSPSSVRKGVAVKADGRALGALAWKRLVPCRAPTCCRTGGANLSGAQVLSQSILCVVVVVVIIIAVFNLRATGATGAVGCTHAAGLRGGRACSQPEGRSGCRSQLCCHNHCLRLAEERGQRRGGAPVHSGQGFCEKVAEKPHFSLPVQGPCAKN